MTLPSRVSRTVRLGWGMLSRDDRRFLLELMQWHLEQAARERDVRLRDFHATAGDILRAALRELRVRRQVEPT